MPKGRPWSSKAPTPPRTRRPSSEREQVAGRRGAGGVVAVADVEVDLRVPPGQTAPRPPMVSWTARIRGSWRSVQISCASIRSADVLVDAGRVAHQRDLGDARRG